MNGNRVQVRTSDHTPESWQGLAGDYQTDRGRQSFAINLSRNVAIASTPPDGSTSTTQGSLLFYGDGVANASLANVGLYALGMREGEIDGAGSSQTRPAIKFQDGTGAIDVTNLVLIDAPDSSLDIDDSQVNVIDSVAYDDDGGAWLTEGGSPSRLLWQGARPLPVVLR